MREYRNLFMRVNKNNLGKYEIPNDVRGGICLDIGANVGNFFNKHADFFSCIHYYEPVNENWELCQEKQHGHVTGFKEVVLGKDLLSVRMAVHKSGDSGSCRVDTNHGDWVETLDYTLFSVSLETCLSRIFKETKRSELDYLKMDCECSEYEILMNKDLSKIKYIALEIHNQLGEEKYTELWNYIETTHTPSKQLEYVDGRNQTILWTRK